MKLEWKLFALVALIYLAIYGVFIGDAWVVESLGRENTMNQVMFGDDVNRHAVSRGQRWFDAHFVDTQIMTNSYTLFIPTDQQADASMGMPKMGEPVFSWFETRLRVMWALVFQAYVRLSVAALWFPYILFLLGPFLVDGVMQRRIKQTNFDFTSPARYSLSYHLIGLLAVVTFLWIFSPFAIPPQVMPAFLVTICFAMGLLSANVHKRI